MAPNCEPCAVCCMVCPPPIMAPTAPEPVRPLSIPCPSNQNGTSRLSRRSISDEDAERFRYDNFYNNYNVDWRHSFNNNQPMSDPRASEKVCGISYDGQSCGQNSYRGYNAKLSKNDSIARRSCPTGFKICEMKLSPPPNCHPCGVWFAEVMPCPPKSKVSTKGLGACTRPGCIHWSPKKKCKTPDDDFCKAHCFDCV